MVSIKDVAKLSGVSVATVSRTLSRPDKVADSTQQRVMRAIEQSGYVTNVLASNFRRRKSQTIVVLVPDIANLYYSKIVQEIEVVARSKGYQILLGETQQDPKIEQTYSDLVHQRMADGVISLGMELPIKVDAKRKTVDPKWPPLVMIGEYTGSVPVPRIGIDNVSAAYDATSYLLGLGHRDIAFVGGPRDFTLCKERLQGFRKALQKFKISTGLDHIQYGEFKLDSGYKQTKKLFDLGATPTALFCANDEIAMGAMKALRELKLRVPEDISIIGFDNLEIADYCSVPLTTIHQPRKEMGREAMTLLLSILNGSSPKETRINLPYQLIVRDSTASPRQ
jgi:LacI family repressor for deo operon, udp, cdd, tsx, nupC, and nupG